MGRHDARQLLDDLGSRDRGHVTDVGCRVEFNDLYTDPQPDEKMVTRRPVPISAYDPHRTQIPAGIQQLGVARASVCVCVCGGGSGALQ